MRHMGPITCLKFHGSTHLVSGSEDSKLNVWRTRDWTCLAALQGHKAGIIDCDIHPTGRIMLSCAVSLPPELFHLSIRSRLSSLVYLLPSLFPSVFCLLSSLSFSVTTFANLFPDDSHTNSPPLSLPPSAINPVTNPPPPFGCFPTARQNCQALGPRQG